MNNANFLTFFTNFTTTYTSSIVGLSNTINNNNNIVIGSSNLLSSQSNIIIGNNNNSGYGNNNIIIGNNFNLNGISNSLIICSKNNVDIYGIINYDSSALSHNIVSNIYSNILYINDIFISSNLTQDLLINKPLTINGFIEIGHNNENITINYNNIDTIRLYKVNNFNGLTIPNISNIFEMDASLIIKDGKELVNIQNSNVFYFKNDHRLFTMNNDGITIFSYNNYINKDINKYKSIMGHNSQSLLISSLSNIVLSADNLYSHNYDKIIRNISYPNNLILASTKLQLFAENNMYIGSQEYKFYLSNDSYPFLCTNNSNIYFSNTYITFIDDLNFITDVTIESNIEINGNLTVHGVATPAFTSFTGSHFIYSSVQYNKDDFGKLVELNELLLLSINQSEFTFQFSSSSKSSNIYGILSYIEDNDWSFKHYDNKYYKYYCNCVGEGGIYVINSSQSQIIKCGTFLQSSSIKGFAEAQIDQSHRSYSVAKTTVDINFNDLSQNNSNIQIKYVNNLGEFIEKINYNSLTDYIVAFISCIYLCG